jgi:hypothetical protein
VPTEIPYAAPGALTVIGPEFDAALADLPTDPLGICRVAQSVLISPDGAGAFHLPAEREAEKSIRRVDALLATLFAHDPAPLTATRRMPDRVVGTCRHFTVLSVALLRARGHAARARCGFAAYFDAGKHVDHWIVEWWDPASDRWVRIDPEMLGLSEILGLPEGRTADLAPDDFLTGGEAWTACGSGGLDPTAFGVHGVLHAWGIAEIRGNAIRDLAALNNVEMLPWDEWGRMAASYAGDTGPEYDALVDAVAAACSSGDPSAIRTTYAREDLTVPASMIR